MIELDEDDAGRGASDDPLDVVGIMDDDPPFLPPSHKLTSKKSRRSASPTQEEPTMDRAWLGPFQYRPDGGATKPLGRKVPKHPSREESPIEAFTSPPPETMEPLPHALRKSPPLELVEQPIPPKKQGGVVRQRVADYNSKGSRQPPLPRIDLRTVQPNMKGQMKKKVCHENYPVADPPNSLYLMSR